MKIRFVTNNEHKLREVQSFLTHAEIVAAKFKIEEIQTNDVEKLVKDKKHFNRFEQAVEFLHIYFGEKKLIKDITQKDNIGFQDFLLSIPSNWKKKKN